MRKTLLTILLVFYTALAFPQCPGPVIGVAVAIPAGSFACTQQAFPAPIGLNSEGVSVTMCFNYYNVGPVNLNYLLVNGLCGPFPLYNTLSFSIYDSSCNAIAVNGSILPTSVNATVTSLTPGTWYTICYTWTPNCPQYSACPLIYTSALPVELLSFNAKALETSNRITWSTASQSQVDSFIVDKSWDLSEWSPVNTVKGAGDTNNQKNYSIDDYDLSTGTLYYRLSEKLYSGQVNILDVTGLVRNTIPREQRVYDLLGRSMGRDFRGIRIITNDADSKVIIE
jgi:hypothetical protein